MHPNLAYSLEQAAALVEIDLAELAWAIEQFGCCDTDAFSVVPADDADLYIVMPRPR